MKWKLESCGVCFGKNDKLVIKILKNFYFVFKCFYVIDSCTKQKKIRVINWAIIKKSDETCTQLMHQMIRLTRDAVNLLDEEEGKKSQNDAFSSRSNRLCIKGVMCETAVEAYAMFIFNPSMRCVEPHWRHPLSLHLNRLQSLRENDTDCSVISICIQFLTWLGFFGVETNWLACPNVCLEFISIQF